MSIVRELVVNEGFFVPDIKYDEHYKIINTIEQLKHKYLDIVKVARSNNYKEVVYEGTLEKIGELSQYCDELTQQLINATTQLDEIRLQLRDPENLKKVNNETILELFTKENELLSLQRNLIYSLREKNNALDVMKQQEANDNIINETFANYIESSKEELKSLLISIDRKTLEKFKLFNHVDYSAGLYEYFSSKLNNETEENFLTEEAKVIIKAELEEMIYILDVINDFVTNEHQLQFLQKFDSVSKRIEAFELLDNLMTETLMIDMPNHLNSVQSDLDIETSFSIYNLAFNQFINSLEFIRKVSNSDIENLKEMYEEISKASEKNENIVKKGKTQIQHKLTASDVCQNIFKSSVKAANIMLENADLFHIIEIAKK